MFKFFLYSSLVFSFLLLYIVTPVENSDQTPSPQSNSIDIAKIATSTENLPIVPEPVEKKEIVVEKNKIQKENLIVKKETPLPWPTHEIEIIDFEPLNETSRKALVNILCTSRNNTLSPLTGSGVVIDPQGIILTNAHIGQFFLLSQYIDCIIRTGSPAYPTYKAELIHISSTWIQDNAFQINKENALGTGENDYALLLITEKIDGTKNQSPVSFLQPSYTNIKLNEYTLLTSYPAGFLGGIAVLRDLYAVSSIAEVSELFTFEGTTVDLFSIGGTVSSQKGSSGGAVIDKEGNLKGIIVTATEDTQTSNRDLRAISIGHIDRNIYRETGKGLEDILENTNSDSIQNFKTQVAPSLREKLIDILQKN
jgi:Trypsin-like peptidase domain